MNSDIQRFDVRLSLQEKYHELTVDRGMDHDAAMRLIQSAVNEWSASQQPASSGAGWVMNCQTFRIRPCDRSAVGEGEMWFETYVDATDYLVQRARR